MLNLISNQIIVEYAEPSSNNLYGDVTSSIGSNPADILKFLFDALGSTVDANSMAKIKTYCINHQYYFSRYINSDNDIYQLILSCSESLNAECFDTSTGVKIVQKTDHENAIEITDYVSKTVNYSEVYTHYKLTYGLSEFSEGEKKTEKSIEKMSQSALILNKEEKRIEISSEWIQDETTAQLFLNAYVDINSRQREIITLDVPVIYEVELGDTILFNNNFYRLTELNNDTSAKQTLKLVEIV